MCKKDWLSCSTSPWGSRDRSSSCFSAAIEIDIDVIACHNLVREITENLLRLNLAFRRGERRESTAWIQNAIGDLDSMT